MSEQIHPAFDAASESVDTRALSQQLGSAEELTTLGPTAYSRHLTKVYSVPALREFLVQYRENILAPHEFRYIHEAAECAGHNQLKELLALDKQLANEKVLKEFQTASHHVGKRQLNRMRLLKDLRVVQRYRDAVNAGEAFGWHTLVYGLVLSTYSLPLRQGLLHYGRQTLGGFIYSAARALELRESTCQELQHEITHSLPPLIQHTLTPRNGCCIKVLS